MNRRDFFSASFAGVVTAFLAAIGIKPRMQVCEMTTGYIQEVAGKYEWTALGEQTLEAQGYPFVEEVKLPSGGTMKRTWASPLEFLRESAERILAQTTHVR